MGEERVVCKCGRTWGLTKHSLHLVPAVPLTCECGRILKDRDETNFWTARPVVTDKDEFTVT
jgi:hypothetical protein